MTLDKGSAPLSVSLPKATASKPAVEGVRASGCPKRCCAYTYNNSSSVVAALRGSQIVQSSLDLLILTVPSVAKLADHVMISVYDTERPFTVPKIEASGRWRYNMLIMSVFV